MVRFKVRRQAADLWRDHRLIAAAVALSLVPRILAMLAFRPALFTPSLAGAVPGQAAGERIPAGAPGADREPASRARVTGR